MDDKELDALLGRIKWLGEYVLDENDQPVKASFKEFMDWMGKHEKHVAEDFIGPARISTVFLGMDIRMMRPAHVPPGYKPRLWETMIFGGKHDLFCLRYTSKQAALEGHQEVVKRLTKEAETVDGSGENLENIN